MDAAVCLRPLRAADVDRIVAEPATGDLSPPGRRDRLLARIEAGSSLEHDGYVEYAVESGDVLAGTVQVRAPKHGFPPGVCELGVTLFAAARGHGVGTGAVRAVTAHLLDTGWARIQAATSVDNLAMQRVLARCGYSCEGVLTAYLPDGSGGREDGQMWAVVADDEMARTETLRSRRLRSHPMGLRADVTNVGEVLEALDET